MQLLIAHCSLHKSYSLCPGWGHVMSRLALCAWNASVRTLTPTTFRQSHTLTSEANNLLNKLNVLATRGDLKEALSSFYSTPQHHHSQLAYATLFHACARHGRLQQGQYLHQHMLSCNPNETNNLFVANHLVNMYAKCGDMHSARQLFDEMPHRNVVSWTALISAYAQRGQAGKCFSLFADMLVHCQPNEFALSSVLTCCDFEKGKQVHLLALKMGFCGSVYVGNALVTMYCKSGDRDGAWNVFETMELRNLFSWNSMISGLQFGKLGIKGIEVFERMYLEGVGFDGTTLVSVLSCLSGSYGGGENGYPRVKCCFQLHCLGVKSGFLAKVEVVTALVKAYSDLGGQVADCYRIFSETTGYRDIILWTGTITAFAEREPEEALFLFRELCREGMAPDWHTFSIVLKACACLGTEGHVLAVHSILTKTGVDADTVVSNALIHAHARCGSISLSKNVFDEMRSRDVVSWNSMLKAYALYGQGREALGLFSLMDVQTDSTTMVALLSACSHAGLVEEGIKIFDSMFTDHGFLPQLDHYTCMVDILGRAGRLIEAKELIAKMPMEPDYVVWSALLGSCRKHGETQLAKLAAERVKELEPENSLGYVQMSNIYCSGGSFDEAGLIRKEMKGSKVRKEPGLSWIEIENTLHEFASGGRRHPQREAIWNKLHSLILQLKLRGYVPETSLSLHDVEEEHKEQQLQYHSEKLALAFAIMKQGSSNGGGGVIRIMKNIRICVDCHNFMKLASDLLQKEIVVRDSNRFHHFKNKICSCNDYW